MRFCTDNYILDITEKVKKENVEPDNVISEPQQFMELYENDTEIDDLITFSTKDLTKHLDNINKSASEKETIIKKYNDLVKQQGHKSEYCYECTKCFKQYALHAGTKIISINYDIDNSIVNNVSAEVRFKNDQTLPRSKDYICPNLKCKSHDEKEFKNKECAWYRTDKNGVNYYTNYICGMCFKEWRV